MPAFLNAYLSFRGNAREAMEFYRSIFGGELSVATFGEFGAAEDPAQSDLVMHSQLTAPNGFKLQGADTPQRVPYAPAGNITLSLSGDDEAALQGYWDKLSAGAEITQPLVKAQWGDMFGMLTDRFGIGWMVNIGAPQ